MTEIIGVRFKGGGKQYYFDPRGLRLLAGQGILLETSRGPEYALCSQGNTMVEDEAVVQPLRPVLRLATERDLETVEQNKIKAKQAYKACQEKIAEHGLDMKLVDVEYNFDGNKILFFFTSEGRVDFRALVKDLAAIFHCRIELRQIGVRDEAKLLGGLGICGKPFCCSTFLEEFQPVSIKMAKTQSLSLNPVKISGTCGRLMCCLKYEQDAYEDAVKRMPKNESFVETPDGVGTVSQLNLLRETVKVRLDSAPEAPHTFHHSEVNVIRSGKGKRPDNYVAPLPQELEKLRKTTPPPEDPSQKLASGVGNALSGIGMTSPHHREDLPPREHRGPQQDHSKGGNPKSGRNLAEPPRAEQRPQRPDRQGKGKTPPPKQGKQPPTATAPQGEGGEAKPNHRRRHRGGGKPRAEGPSPQ